MVFLWKKKKKEKYHEKKALEENCYWFMYDSFDNDECRKYKIKQFYRFTKCSHKKYK